MAEEGPTLPSALIPDLLSRCTFPAEGAPLACAVSGGADSLALLVLAAAAGFRHRDPRRPRAARGSEAEAEVVSAAAARLGARFEGHRVAVAPGANLEARARAARFGVLPDDVATGHTMDDQAETILVNLLRGAGADGLAGMEPGPGHPILGLRRRRPRAVCRGGSGAGARREQRRPGVRPQPHPPRAAAAVRGGGRSRSRPAAGPAGRRVPRRGGAAGLAGGEAAADPTDARAVAAADRPLARRAVRRWLREAGEGEHPPSLAEVDRTLAVAAGAVVGTELTGGRRVRRTGGRLRVEPSRRSGSVTPVTLDESGAGVPSWAAADVGPALVDAERLAARVAELGQEITRDYARRIRPCSSRSSRAPCSS